MQFGPQDVVWITGASGRIGRALEPLFDRSRYIVITTDAEVDVSDLEAVKTYVNRNRPNIIVNCASLSSREQAIANPHEAYRVNTLGARNLAIVSAQVGALLVHFSTDDVFAGNTKASVNEFDTAYPRDVFGKSKLAGENFVRELNEHHIIIRSSWVYANREDNFFGQILDAARKGEKIAVSATQVSSPTSVATFASFVISVIESGEFGLFHAACEGTVSRLEFAKRILELAGLSTDCVVGDYNSDDSYFLDLENLMLELTGVFQMPNWEDDLKAYMQNQGLLA